MHDPQTVAHEIRWPWKNKHKYRTSIVTIWHCDPEKNVLGTRDDDSCGWFSPGYTEQEAEKIRILAKDQYSSLFARQVAIHEGKSYASGCYNQDIYGAIYWSWRAIKAHGKLGWQYGKPLTAAELDYIYSLATNPVDNFQSRKISNYDQFEEFFFSVWRCFRKFHRPWYKHPRWHIHHWKIQFHPLQQLKRRFWDKCEVCGKRGFTGSAYALGIGICHHKCHPGTKLSQSNQGGLV